MQETVSIPGSGRSPEKEMATHSSILAWRIPWTEEPGDLQSMGSQRVRHNWATNTVLHGDSKKFIGCQEQGGREGWICGTQRIFKVVELFFPNELLSQNPTHKTAWRAWIGNWSYLDRLSFSATEPLYGTPQTPGTQPRNAWEKGAEQSLVTRPVEFLDCTEWNPILGPLISEGIHQKAAVKLRIIRKAGRNRLKTGNKRV